MGSIGTMTEAAMTNKERLAAIDEFDAKPAKGVLHKVGMTLGPKPWFISVYRRLGPKIDPLLSRVGDGSLVRSIYGLPTMLIHTKGAKSGQPRSNPLLYARDGEDFIVVGTNFGQPKHPAWTANLLAHPDAEVEIGTIMLPVKAALIEGEEWDAVFARLVAIYPGYALYLDRRGDLPPRLFRLIPQT
jgi:deazaflavin-dependent oxidoreductase (nitroreductase family)